MKCTGLDALSGEPIELTFSGVLEGVDDLVGVTVPAAGEPAVYIAAGWIDIQVNGYAGVDYNSPAASHEAIGHSLKALFASGVTRLFPTIITGSPQDMVGALRNLAAAREQVEHGSAIEAFHMEGPHISPDDGPRGAHPKQWVRPPDFDEYQRWQEAACGHVRLVTLAPEWPQATAYIEQLVRDGVVVAIGHTKASSEQIAAATDAGATLSTHLGNGADPFPRRHPNYIWDQLAEDRLAASFIVDGMHLPASFLKVALRAKGLERSVLITDAVMPAGCAPGCYKLGEVDVEMLPEGRVVLRGGTRLAGSSLRIDRGVENLMRIAGLSLRDADRKSVV
jgi:N-acetylglucosamine-6-phosphate deacetylase